MELHETRCCRRSFGCFLCCGKGASATHLSGTAEGEGCGKAQAAPLTLDSPVATPPPDAPEEKQEDKMIKGYVTHQSIELGGHIVDQSGSGAMYDTLVNLSRSTNAQSVAHDARYRYFPSDLLDDLSTSSFGYGATRSTLPC